MRWCRGAACFLLREFELAFRRAAAAEAVGGWLRSQSFVLAVSEGLVEMKALARVGEYWCTETEEERI